LHLRTCSGTVNSMDDYDYCEECKLYGDDYSYDKDGGLVSNCYDCPMNTYVRGEGHD